MPEALLWRDANKIAEAERFAPKIDAGLREARLLLAVLSRNYVKRPYCLHELKSFAELKGDEAIVRIGKHLVGEKDIPGPLKEREGYNFFVDQSRDRRGRGFFDRGEVVDGRYHQAMRRLARYVFGRLRGEAPKEPEKKSRAGSFSSHIPRGT